MPIRMSGLVSNLDTDAIVKELMSAQRLKKTKIEQKKTKLEWTQDKWKELNTKLYSFYTDYASKMRLQTSYKTKAVTSSDTTKVSATAGANAATGSHTISVKQLASAQYLTSNKVTLKGSSDKVSGTTKLKDLGFTTDGKNTVINISGTKDVSFIVKADSTVNDLVAAFQKAGLNASFDTTQQRFFVSSTNSGMSQQFSVTTSTVSNAFVAIGENLQSLVGYSTLSSADRDKVDAALKTFNYGGNGGTVDINKLTDEQADAHLVLVDFATKAAKAKTVADANTAVRNAVIANEFAGKTREQIIKESLAASIKKDNDILTNEEVDILVEKQYGDMDDTDRETLYNKIIDAKVAEVKGQDSYKNIYNNYIADKEETNINNALSQLDIQLVEYAANSGETKYTVGDNTPLSYLGMAEISLEEDDKGITRVRINGSSGSMTSSESNNTLQYGGMSLVAAQDAVFVLDGAELTSENNSFTVNNLNLTLTGVTSSPVSLNVINDTQATYDMIKDFIKQYNTLLKEMNELYNADSARGYEPLTDEEKEAMTDDQIEKWEKKIKDSLLRKDSTLSSLTSALKMSMQYSVDVNGKKYSLSSFGICTSFDYKENGLLHIYGDASDSTYSTESDKLMKALSENPEETIQALTGIFQKLYDTMADKMKATTLSSSLTFYNDKQMKTQLSDYAKQISKWEDRLEEMEERYYKQFSAMESAMATLNSQSSYLSNLMG